MTAATRTRVAVATIAVALPLSAAACSKSDTTSTASSTTTASGASSTTTSAPGGGNQVNSGASIALSEFAYDPKEITIKANEAVTWTNKGSAKHTVTASPGQSITFKSETMQPNDTFVFTFGEPGTYKYFCSVHGQDRMSGTIVVTP